MPLKITKDTNLEGKWFLYGEDVEFKIRPLFSTTIRDLGAQAQTGRQVMDPRTKRMVPEIDNEKLESLIENYLIEDWKGIQDEDGNAVAPTPENKKALLNLVAISDFIWEMAKGLDITAERQKN